MILKGARFIITQDDKRRIIEGEDVRIQKDRIAEVGKEIKKERGEEVIDVKGKIILPGLVNSHNHTPMILFRGYEDDKPLNEWLKKMWAREGHLTGEVARYGSKIALLESLANGITTTLDMYEAQEVAKAALELGVRVANGPPLISIFSSYKERLKATEKFYRTYRKNPLIIPVVNLHSIYTNDEEAIIKAGELSKTLNVPLNVHVSETRQEIYTSKEKNEKLPVEYLDDLGALWKKTVLVHLGWVARWEIERIGKMGSKVVHCPSSNMKLGTGGFFPYPVFKEKGIAVGLGTDSAASNNTQDIFREMREMALIQKHQYWKSDIVQAQDPLDAATRGGAEIIGIRSGRIQRGFLADIAVLSISPRLLPIRRENVISNIVYSATGSDVEMVFIAGRLRYSKGSEDFKESLINSYDKVSGFLDELKNP